MAFCNSNYNTQLPEGLATGVGFGSGNISDGITIATAIAIQNLPEGLAVALSLRGVGYSKKRL